MTCHMSHGSTNLGQRVRHRHNHWHLLCDMVVPISDQTSASMKRWILDMWKLMHILKMYCQVYEHDKPHANATLHPKSNFKLLIQMSCFLWSVASDQMPDGNASSKLSSTTCNQATSEGRIRSPSIPCSSKNPRMAQAMVTERWQPAEHQHTTRTGLWSLVISTSSSAGCGTVTSHHIKVSRASAAAMMDKHW